MLQRLNRSSISARRTSSSTASAPLLRTYAHTATTSCTAPLVMMRLGESGSRTTTLMRLRAKSYGISSSLATPVLVQPVGEAGLQGRVEIGRARHLIGCVAQHIDRAIDTHHASGERAGLVGAEHVHAAKALDGIETAHNYAVARHVARTACERHGEKGGQKQEREAACEHEGE